MLVKVVDPIVIPWCLQVNLFTLNCWGLGLGISKNRDERMQDIGQWIAQQEYDIVFLQVEQRIVMREEILFSDGVF